MSCRMPSGKGAAHAVLAAVADADEVRADDRDGAAPRRPHRRIVKVNKHLWQRLLEPVAAVADEPAQRACPVTVR